jgi:hypothetical protein
MLAIMIVRSLAERMEDLDRYPALKQQDIRAATFKMYKEMRRGQPSADPISKYWRMIGDKWNEIK